MASPAISTHLLPVVVARQEVALAAAVPVLAVEVPQAEVVPAVAVYLGNIHFRSMVLLRIPLTLGEKKMFIKSQSPVLGR